MNISYNPNFKTKAQELRKFLKENKITHNINYIIGGDGSLFTYASHDQPNFLISPKTSVGYYATASFDNYQKKLLNYDAQRDNKEFATIEVTINNKKLPDKAINDVLITEGLHKYSKMIINGNEELNSGIIFYTHHGWSGYAQKIGAQRYDQNEIGLIAFFPPKKSLLNKSIKSDTFTINIVKRQQAQSFKLYIDCKDVNPFKKGCTDRKRIHYKPYKLKPASRITINKGKPVIIIK